MLVIGRRVPLTETILPLIAVLMPATASLHQLQRWLNVTNATSRSRPSKHRRNIPPRTRFNGPLSFQLPGPRSMVLHTDRMAILASREFFLGLWRPVIIHLADILAMISGLVNMEIPIIVMGSDREGRKPTVSPHRHLLLLRIPEALHSI